IARQEQALRGAEADVARQPLGAAPARDGSERHLGEAPDAVGEREPDVARKRELDAAAERVALDGRDRQRRGALESRVEVLPELRVRAPVLDSLAQLLQVGAGAERSV